MPKTHLTKPVRPARPPSNGRSSGGRSEKSASKQTATACEALIVGGGFSGLVLALALDTAGLKSIVIDKADPAEQSNPTFDGRAFALSHASQQLLCALGVWPLIKNVAEPILDIRVSEGSSPFFLHYDHRELDSGPDAAPFGYMVESRDLRSALFMAAAKARFLTIHAPASLESMDRDLRGIKARLADGRLLRAKVAVAADGRGSMLREHAGIQVMERRYQQTGIVGTVIHEKSHQGVAVEKFLPAGPFAILPLMDDKQGRHRSSIVWTENEGLAPQFLKLDEIKFNYALQARFGDFLGKVRIEGPRWSYPLTLLHAERYTDTRLALVADAAHGIHPIAGQGLNLGLRDVAALAEVFFEAHQSGQDIGHDDVLGRYVQWRRFDIMTLIGVTDGLNRLFSNDSTGLRFLRSAGLAGVNALPPLKRFFMRHAMGILGDRPKLLRGVPLSN